MIQYLAALLVERQDYRNLAWRVDDPASARATSADVLGPEVVEDPLWVSCKLQR